MNLPQYFVDLAIFMQRQKRSGSIYLKHVGLAELVNDLQQNLSKEFDHGTELSGDNGKRSL